jgi:hypothetical protein
MNMDPTTSNRSERVGAVPQAVRCLVASFSNQTALPDRLLTVRSAERADLCATSLSTMISVQRALLPTGGRSTTFLPTRTCAG